MYFGDSPMFQRNILSHSSGLKRKPSKKPAEVCSKLNLFGIIFDPEDGGCIFIPLKHPAVSRPHGVGTQKRELFIIMLHSWLELDQNPDTGVSELNYCAEEVKFRGTL
jgi:hypothetical protein